MVRNECREYNEFEERGKEGDSRCVAAEWERRGVERVDEIYWTDLAVTSHNLYPILGLSDWRQPKGLFQKIRTQRRVALRLDINIQKVEYGDVSPSIRRLLPRRLRNRCRPLHNLSREQRDPRAPQRTHPENIPIRDSQLGSKLITYLFHTFADVPVNKRALRVHQVKLVVYKE